MSISNITKTKYRTTFLVRTEGDEQDEWKHGTMEMNLRDEHLF